MADQEETTESTPDDTATADSDSPADDQANSSLVGAPDVQSAAIVQFRGKPGSPQMLDPEGRIRSGQFRGNSRIARHPSHRPYEPD